jgi:acetyl-CoA carboxylase carboxyl transferase subunit alpha
VISPEGCAAILWKDRAHTQDAAEAMKLTAGDLKKLNLVDEVIGEPLGGAHRNHEETAAALKMAVVRHLRELAGKTEEELLGERYSKFRKIGAFGASKNGASRPG